MQAVVALLNACSMKYTGKLDMDEGELRTEWKMPTFDLETDTWAVFAPQDKLVGHVNVVDQAPHVRFWANVDVHPDYEGRLIGDYLRRWADERARQSVAKAPEGARVVSRCGVDGTNTAAQALLSQQSYQIVRHFFRMVIDLDAPPPEPVLPEGIVIRPFVRERETRALVMADRESFQDHWGYVESPIEEELVEWETWMTDPAFDESLWFVAM
ncbi:MAG: hypothetical protein GY851_34770, partial [bacterium]|nr:hypothetical protein [bacterium]